MPLLEWHAERCADSGAGPETLSYECDRNGTTLLKMGASVFHARTTSTSDISTKQLYVNNLVHKNVPVEL